MKHIGILAHSFEGATLCFHTACLEGVKRLGAHMHPEITMTCSPMALVLDAWERGDNAELRTFFRKDSEKLAAAGADFFVCPDNTAHIALEAGGVETQGRALEAVGENSDMLHSTVTLFARLRGWSTSVPFSTATW